MASFEIGGAVVPMEAGDGRVNQTYTPKHVGNLLQMAGGNSFKQSLIGALDKVKTELSSQDTWTPPGLVGLDYSSPLLLKCGAPRSEYNSDPEIVITSNRRSDEGYTPRGYGIVNGKMVETSITIVNNTVQLTSVENATGYMVTFWPEIYVFARFEEKLQGSNAVFEWKLICEEV